jgi:outer membrane receptor protein involved in Fe transport
MKIIKIVKPVIILMLWCISIKSFAQQQLSIIVKDEEGNKIENASINYNNQLYNTDSNGACLINVINENTNINISKIGFTSFSTKLEISNNKTLIFALKDAPILINKITVKGKKSNELIAKIDVQERPANSSQDLLKLVPGLFIAQHAGGGKAEQIFMRGFDIDHGTDFAIHVDGMPVNMTSHAHGQGYADLHFLIPETVEKLEVNKGPHTTKYGDLATAGAGEFTTIKTLNNNLLKLESGMYNTHRALLMLNVLDKKHLFSKQKENMYIAAEYKYSDAYFESKQYFNRLNFMAKYNGILNDGSTLTLLASTFGSNWDASGQIPQRSINDGSITRYGSIDDTEGGQTSRTNVNIIHEKNIGKAKIKNQLFYNKYDFNLYSNFTFYLNDSINGDQIYQKDDRNIIGYNGLLSFNNKIANKQLFTNLGIGARYDNADIALSRSVKRKYVSDMVNGKLNQINAWVYADENINITNKLNLNLGVRLDAYNFNFKNNTNVQEGGAEFKAIVSPKLNVQYTLNDKVQLYAKSGYGFHSNDARAVVIGKLENTLPKAFGNEIGTTSKVGKNILVNFALWTLDLESELVYVGDEGIVEASGATRRYGVDASIRAQLANKIFIDADVNYNKGSLINEPKDANKIPLAPVITSAGGISYKQTKGLNVSGRYRYMGSRAANEDNSLIANGYFLLDANVNYVYKNLSLGIVAENLLNTNWKEAQFATESKLKNETNSVEEIHFTPGTPFNARLVLSYKF